MGIRRPAERFGILPGVKVPLTLLKEGRNR
jgi:hypothetical protein